MTNFPLVTIIIPSFNHGKYISRAIDSVLNQDSDDWELIIIDDGSKDGTADVLSNYLNRPRVSVVLNPENKGQGAVINRALTMAVGKYISFLPSDDWYLPGKISAQLKKFEEVDRRVGVVYARGYRYYEDTGENLPVKLPMYKGNVLEQLITRGNFIYPITPMFRRECFDDFPFDESYKAEGEAIYTKIALKYDFDFVEDYVAVMRDHSYNTGKITNMMYLDNLRYWTDFFQRDDLPPDLLKLKNYPLVRLHRLKGIESIVLRGDSVSGRKALQAAVSLDPALLLDIKVIAAFFLSFIPNRVAGNILKLHSSFKKSRQGISE